MEVQRFEMYAVPSQHTKRGPMTPYTPHFGDYWGQWKLLELTGVNGGCQILDIGWGLSELVDIKGAVRMSRG